ncbi:eukaryotic elongation factor, selenocysteine-tRNA specific [Homo sapiens]|uniref:Selenocysteine-specific elongation factor n=2 Tax=Homo sapiens TaxID=9606 RepID=SELB_HUMAN|nr:selenocysteine-specific elongation factor [Homo sapiens]P57772.4 RecName: Full=Selenocysteine-specific elongation factor; AltName: Full=Elongation factor sec; AltName: Full=Eukaryotic elongation factor, selenocysteine-tRNA-specific [Homo sapiens]EAW79322.1 eukaryotic elongation factor, selenocysteine-tRNA-specific [Homo sapiens]KAI2531352.1 eukaryotic elongation factor, selenocysteine-tRNA specific [Homo sapiens]KAI4031421.1 eukaryotic elongation factor, selenocysteine-tRNA specific [Homo sa|eukprot:NP_068756.2 selenocysteine-specific elongation factor [Homo sapiens]
MAGRRVNVNVGVLGHIDSGKTALARALSTTASTAAFDKQPQSRERGITLDLGFSCFSVPLPARLRSSLPEFQAAPEAEPEPGEPLLQVTLVDCPGHASLIRTIIGGAQIIDLMMLVIDVTKGMQTQSAECLVIGQIACQKLVVVLNKIDLLPEGKRQAAIDKMTKKMQKTLENTKFRGAPIIPVAAKPGGPEAPETEAPQGIPELIELLTSQISIPTRDPSGPFLMSVDHCFSIKGQGTVMTGTILSGSISLGDSVEIPALKVVKKVKSMQMFHMPITSAMQGDRLGICVTQFDPKLLERGLVCAPESLHTVHAALISVEKIPYFRGPLQTKAKFHITVGHETVMGRLMFFSPAPDNFDQEPILDSFNFSQEYLFQEQYLSKDLTPAVTDNDEADKKAGQATEGHCPRQQWALVEFEKPVTCPRLCLVIGSRLDADIHTNTCRLAFHGILLHGLEDRNYADSFLPRLKVYKLKHKHGLVERAMDDYSVIGRSLFKKETNIQLFVGLKVHLSTGELGIIDSAFGQSGKFKIHIPGGLSPESKKILTPALKKRARAGRGEATRQEESAERSEPSQHVVLSLTFKRYVFDTHKRMVQSP